MQTVLQIFYPVVHHKVSYTINILGPNVQGLVQALQSYEEISYPYPYFLSICRIFKQTAGMHLVSQFFSVNTIFC